MNKLFTKIAGAVLGLTMAVGVGVGVGTSWKEVVPVSAAISSAEESNLAVLTSSNFDTSAEYVLKSTDGYYWNGVSGTSSNNKWGGITKTLSDVARVTISGTWADGFTIKDSSDKYLRATTGNMTWATTSPGTFTQGTDSANNPIVVNGTSNGLKVNGTSGMRLYTNLTYNSSTGKSVALYKIISKTLSSIALSGTYPTSFYTGDTFSHSGMTVTATYIDGTTANVTSSATFSGYNMSTTGSQTVTVSYTEGGTTKTATYTITVSAAPEPLSAELNGDMETKTYVEGTAYDVTGLYVTITYDNDDTRDFNLTDLTKDTDYVLDHDNAVLGDTSLDITGEYLGCVFDGTVTGITVTEAPKVATYTISGLNTSPTVTPSGLVPTGTTATWSNTYTGSNIGQDTNGNSQTLTISGFSKGTIITGIKLYMHSNGSAGAGYASYMIDSGSEVALVGTVGSATAFNTWGDNTTYGTSWRYVTLGTNYNISVPAGSTFKIKVACVNTNSLYCTGFTLNYAYADPTFTVAPLNHEVYTGENAASTVTVANFDTDPTLEYEVISGASSISTVSISSYSSHVATVTITASSTAGTAVVRVRDSANPSTYYGDITVVVNEIPAYEIELSADSYAYVGDDVDVVVTTSRLQGTGINWSVISGSVDSESVISDDTEYMATITSAGTLTIKATDNGNAENYATVSITVVGRLNAVNAPSETDHASELTFDNEYADGGEKVDGAASTIWTVESDGTESTYDSINGIHYGTNDASVQYVQLSTSSIATGTNDIIKSIVVNTQDRATSKGSLTVTVGGVSFKHEGSASVTVTGAATDYTFTGNGTGEIVVKVDRGSAAKKAIYVKSVTVNYVTENGSSNIANAANMYLAQKAVIDYANDFNTALEAVCVAYGSTDTTDLENAWNDLAEQYVNWFNNGDKDLTSEEIAHAKALFANADSVDRNKTPSADDLQHMLAKYDWIISHYQLNDFLANDSGTNRPIVQNSSPRIGIFGNIDSSNTTAIIVIVSLVSLTAVGGYFFLRKRKEEI